MKALKLKPGKRIGEILEMIKDLQIKGKVKTKKDALAQIKKLKNT